MFTKYTKVVATIGPATESEETLRQLILSGMNIARFNTKHSTPEWHAERVQRVRNVAGELNVAVGVLLDLQGPEIRLSIPGEKAFDVSSDDEVVFTSDTSATDPRSPIIPQIVVDTLQPEDTILIDDGVGEFIVKKTEGNKLFTQVVGTFTVGHRKTMNTPGVTIDLPSLIEQDIRFLDEVPPQNIDFVGLSFVRDASDIHHLQKALDERAITADIIAKIENQSAIDHIDEIIEVADGIMVARGDLAVEVPFEELSHWQKTIISKCRQAAKPVITATQMLKSMVESPRPTRAEVSDVSNAIYDGTDAVMLSEETTIGKFPVEAVHTQSVIAQYNEQHAVFDPMEIVHTSVSSCVTHSAMTLVADVSTNAALEIDKIICFSESGMTAKLLARYRPTVPVYVLTSSSEVRNKLALLYGVHSLVFSYPEGESLQITSKVVETLKANSVCKTGETILLIHGASWRESGKTNTVSLITVEK